MLDDYIYRFYDKEGKRSKLLKANNFAKAKEIAAWKQEVASKWNEIEISSVSIPEGYYTILMSEKIITSRW